MVDTGYNLNFPPQLRPTSRKLHFPLVLVIPPEKARAPELAVINRQWRRLADGSIEAVFNSAEELELCIQATRAARGNQILAEATL